MKASDKYKSVFGEIKTLAESISWATGVSNMLEWLTWSTNDVLGVTKTQYRKMIVELSHDELIRNASIEEKQKYVADKLDLAIADSEQLERYAKPKSSVATPREALRRAKYFSEDYLNKEFDIFWSLVSDIYLDTFYRQFIDLKGQGEWFSHGNSGLFGCSTNIRDMQMDNLSYSQSEKILIANELKLGGKKNPDQILKYALMYRQLRDRGFIKFDTQFLLLFIGDKPEHYDWDDLIEKEIDYCNKSKKSTCKAAIEPEGIDISRNAKYASVTWGDLVSFNENYISTLDERSQQVEYKLLRGFNETLSEKAFMN